MLREVRDLISLILLEDKYKQMTGKRYTGDIEKFRKNLSKTKDEALQKRMFIHFTDTLKLGINPSGMFTAGYYFYPLTKEIFNHFVLNVNKYERGQARAARYVYLVEIDRQAKILDSERIYPTIVENLEKIVFKPVESLLLKNLLGWDKQRPESELRKRTGVNIKDELQIPVIKEIHEALQDFDTGDENGFDYDLDELENGNINKFIKKKEKYNSLIKSYNEKIEKIFQKYGLSSAQVFMKNMSIKKISDEDSKNSNSIIEFIQRYEKTRDFIDKMHSGISQREKLIKLKLSKENKKTEGEIRDEERLPYGFEIYNAILNTYDETADILNLMNTVKESFAPSDLGQDFDRKNRSVPIDSTKHMISKVLKHLKNPGNYYVSKNGSLIKGEDIKGEFEKIYNKFIEETGITERDEKDPIGFLIKIAICKEYDGIFDKGVGAGDIGYDQGAMGKLSQQEATQLYMTPGSRKYFKILSVIDRFEGEKEGIRPEWGHHTPDVRIDVDDRVDPTTEPPRATYLRQRLKKGEKEPGAGGSRERYEDDGAP